MTELLYATDACLREFESEVVAVDAESGAVALAATAFFPTGGGQPNDLGTLRFGAQEHAVADVRKDRDGVVWHVLADGAAAAPGASAHGELDWERRHLLMRTHTALHVLNGVIWIDHGARVTGAQMTPGEGRLDFELPALSQEFARAVEGRVNAEIERDLPVEVRFLPRVEADRDPSLIRLKANLIPREIDPLRVIDIVGLDRQADGGTHVASTGEIARSASRRPSRRARRTSASGSRSRTDVVLGPPPGVGAGAAGSARRSPHAVGYPRARLTPGPDPPSYRRQATAEKRTHV